MVSSSSVVSKKTFEIGWKFFFFDSLFFRFLYLRVRDCESHVCRLWLPSDPVYAKKFQQYDFITTDLVLSVRERDSFCHVPSLEHVRISCNGMDTSSVIPDSDVTAILSTFILWRNDKYDWLVRRRRDQTESYFVTCCSSVFLTVHQELYRLVDACDHERWQREAHKDHDEFQHRDQGRWVPVDWKAFDDAIFAIWDRCRWRTGWSL